MVCEAYPQRIRPRAKTSGRAAVRPTGAFFRPRGFSLVELIVVIVITGIIASVIGSFIAGPIQGFFDQARRAELVDAAQLALVRMGRDLRAALPNSVRIDSGALELLLALDGDRYRTEPAAGAGDADQLQFTAEDTSFNTFRQLGANQTLAAGVRLAVYPLGYLSASDPYAAPAILPSLATAGVMTPANIVGLTTTSTVGGVTEYRVTLTGGGHPGHLFPYESPRRRVFLVGGPVMYRCVGGDLIRYDNYGVNPTPLVPPTDIGTVTTVVVADIVQSCAFSYDPGTARRNAVATLTVTLVDPASPTEIVRLVRQVHMNNVP
jgi:MSHA biogenesis protein MshO